jgi:Conjugal transfer protein TraD
VWFGHAVFAEIPMHIEIGDHAPLHEFGPDEVAGEFNALCLRHLSRDGEFDLAGKLGVFPDFERLDIVPEPFSVAPCLRRIFGQHHFGLDDAALSRKIVTTLKPVVAQPRGGAVGCRRHCATARLAANDLDVKMIDRHRDRISGTAERTSERRISAPSLEKFSGGITSSQAVPATLQHYAEGSTIIAPSTLMEATMRKPRDFDGELKALQDKARDLKSRKVQQLGELVIATGADSLSADELAGALIMLAETKDAAKREAWAKSGATFFQGRSRRSAPAPGHDAGGAAAQPSRARPASGSAGAA